MSTSAVTRKVSVAAVAAALLVAAFPSLASDATPKDTAAEVLRNAATRMITGESGDAAIAAAGMATEWGNPATEGRAAAIFGQMRANHVFGRRLTTGDFREDLLVGFDSKANMRFAVLHGGMGDSCSALAGKKYALTIATRAGKIALDGGAPRAYEAATATGTDKGCFVQLVANSSKLRELLNQSPELPTFFALSVDGEERKVFYKSAGRTVAFWQTAEVLKARQNFAIVNY